MNKCEIERKSQKKLRKISGKKSEKKTSKNTEKFWRKNKNLGFKEKLPKKTVLEKKRSQKKTCQCNPRAGPIFRAGSRNLRHKSWTGPRLRGFGWPLRLLLLIFGRAQTGMEQTEFQRAKYRRRDASVPEKHDGNKANDTSAIIARKNNVADARCFDASQVFSRHPLKAGKHRTHAKHQLLDASVATRSTAQQRRQINNHRFTSRCNA